MQKIFPKKLLFFVLTLVILFVALSSNSLAATTQTKASTATQTNASKNGKAQAYTMLRSGQIPVELAGRKLSNKQINDLVGLDPTTVKAALATVGDVVAWFNASNFKYMDGAWWTNNPDSYYGRYESGQDSLGSDQNAKFTGNDVNLGVDNVSISAAWLLQDDFKDVGVVAAMVKGNMPNYIVAYIKKDNNYYVIDFATLITNTVKRVRYSMMASVKTKDLSSLSTIVKDTANTNNFVLLGITNHITERLHYAKYGSNAEFTQPDKVKTLYSAVANQRLDQYVIASGTKSTEMSIADYKIPAELRKATMTAKQAAVLVGKDPATIAAAVHTVSDMLLYMHAAGFQIDNGDKQLVDGSVSWHFNNSAVTSLSINKANCGASANTVRYLLNGDYDEVGYVCHTYKDGGGGGHVYNYIKTGGKYYIFDLTAYTESDYSTGALAIIQVKSLQDYANVYKTGMRYGDYLPVIYTYNSAQEIPMAWNNSDTYMTWYPTGTKLTVIACDAANGYRIDYRDITADVLSQINTSRTDRKISSNDKAAFRGIEAYNLPSALGGMTLTAQQITDLVNSSASLDKVSTAVKTVGDAMAYLYAAGFKEGPKDILTSASEGQEWRSNFFAESAFKRKEANCGASANLVRRLLDGDYDEVGYVCHTLATGEGGGHVYNYVKKNGEYFIVDLNAYLVCKYAPIRVYVMSVGNDLKSYAGSWQQMYSSENIKVIYSYNEPVELPISWSIFDDVYVTYLPDIKKNIVNIILESDGYKVGYAKLSTALWNFINTKR